MTLAKTIVALTMHDGLINETYDAGEAGTVIMGGARKACVWFGKQFPYKLYRLRFEASKGDVYVSTKGELAFIIEADPDAIVEWRVETST